MTHLYIELNTGLTEEVNSSIISKLYELAISGDLDNTSDLKGRLHSSTAKEKHVTYLNNNFDELYISADTQYISFDDPDMETYMKRYIGTNEGVSLLDVLTFITSGTDLGNSYVNTHNGSSTALFIAESERASINSFDEISLFNGVTALGNMLFADSNISSIILPSTITTLREWDFANCTNLTSINLDNIQYLYAAAFFNSGLTGIINLPSIKQIGVNSGLCFMNCSNITEINCGNSFEQFIGSQNFSGCTNLQTVTGLSNITTIPNNTFEYCNNLSSIDIDWTKITSINLYAFDNCTSLLIGQLSVPNITFLGQFAFRNTKVLTVTNLGSITTLQPQVFRGCSSLTSVTLPATITEIRNHAFCDCTSLTTINIPSTCTSIYNNAFEACSNLDVTLDLSNVTDIGAQAFKDCTKLKISNLPKASSYSSQSFLAAKGLTNVVIPKEVVTIGSSCFNQCTNIQTVTFELNSQLDYIKDNAFNSCSSLLTLIIPEGCTKIGDGAFASSGITLLDIPSTVTEIGSIAFRNLPLAATIIFRCNVPTFGSTSDIFAYSSYDLQLSTVSIYVPDDLVAAYKAVPCLSNVINHIYGISQMPNS